MSKDTSFASEALLPAGFSDLLYPQSASLYQEIDILLDHFKESGYQYVSAPLLEYEESYLAGAGAALSQQCFRIMDPQSQKMMVLRPDITPQMARIASTRLRKAHRPLRLCYCGTCITVKPVSAEETRRQIMQTGIELIGPDSAQTDVEVLQLGARALEKIGIHNFSFDLTMPPFVPCFLEECHFPTQACADLMHALSYKDVSYVRKHAGQYKDDLLSLMDASGDARRAMAILDKLALPAKSQAIYARFKQTVLQFLQACPELTITIDLAEFRGWQYHTGVCVSIFSDSYSQELGRGGRYKCYHDEPAFGLTLRPDILRPMSTMK